MKSYVCKDQREDHESESVEFFILSALGDGFPRLSLFRQDFFILSVSWPPFSAPACLNQCIPTIKGKGGFTPVMEPLDMSYTDQQPKAQEVIDSWSIPKYIFDIQQRLLPHWHSGFIRTWICVKRKLFHTKLSFQLPLMMEVCNVRPTLF